MNIEANEFELDRMIDAIRIAAAGPDASGAVKAILQSVVSQPAELAASMPKFTERDVILFEDETVSTWYCRFLVGQTVPAHDHQMLATVAVYDGVERNEIWERNESGDLRKKMDVRVGPGDVLQMGPDDIHSVSCDGEIDSQAIHVYLGKLTTVKRSLFNPSNGEVMSFDDENYYRLIHS